jgi:hypothetical protein
VGVAIVSVGVASAHTGCGGASSSFIVKGRNWLDVVLDLLNFFLELIVIIVLAVTSLI